MSKTPQDMNPMSSIPAMPFAYLEIITCPKGLFVGDALRPLSTFTLPGAIIGLIGMALVAGMLLGRFTSPAT